MNSDEINQGLCELEGDKWEHLVVPAMQSSGKVVPYIGWFWRTVDFDAPICLADPTAGGQLLSAFDSIEERDGDVPPWVGFCQNNKWDYDMFRLNDKQSAEVRRLCEELARNKTLSAAAALFDYLQSTRPAP